MLRAPFLFEILTICLFLLFVKSHHFTVKKKTQPLAIHQTKSIFLIKKGPFFINCDPDPKGIHIFYLEIKPQQKYNKWS